MQSSTGYSKEYGEAQQAYLQGNYQEAAKIIDQMATEFPQDPSILLLRGHIYCYGLHKYKFAQQQYQSVLDLTDESELVNYAHNGLEQARQFQSSSDRVNSEETVDTEVIVQEENWLQKYRDEQRNFPEGEDFGVDEEGKEQTLTNPFVSSEQSSWQENDFNQDDDTSLAENDEAQTDLEWQNVSKDKQAEFNYSEMTLDALDQEFSQNLAQFQDEENTLLVADSQSTNTDFSQGLAQEEKPINSDLSLEDSEEYFTQEIELDSFIDYDEDKFADSNYVKDYGENDDDIKTIELMGRDSPGQQLNEEKENIPSEEDYAYFEEEEDIFDTPKSQGIVTGEKLELDNFEGDKANVSLLPEAAIVPENDLEQQDIEEGFLEEFDIFNDDDLNNIPNFDLGDVDQDLADSGFFSANC